VTARFDVAIAGFGPVGATCASLLGRLGLRTLVLDKSRTVYDRPRAFALDHEIMRVFQGIGVADAVLPHTAPFTPSEYYGADGALIKRLGSVPPPWPLGWPPNLVFTQPPVEAALRRRAGEHPGVEIALGSELVGLAQSADAVALELVTDSGERQKVEARYLVGCDGASSTVRALAGIALEDLAFDEPWLVVDLLVNERGRAKLPAVSIQYCEPARPCTYLIGPGAHRRWEIMVLPGEDRHRLEEDAEVWRLLARWLAPDDATLWRRASYRFHALVAREWRRGRVFLAGDAAHQQPPFTGQGMCQGIRDVANLAWKLARVLAGEAGDSLLDTYGAERGAHVRRLTGAVKDIGRLICERDPAAARARDERLLREAGGRIETVPRQNLIPPLAGGFLAPAAHPANGTVFPQPRVLRGDGFALLDDLAGPSFRIVVDGGFRLAALRRVDLLARLGARLVRIGAANPSAADGALDVVETDGVVAGWFERGGCASALVRPDHYVYGIAGTAGELDRLLESAAAALG
jgi:3-(3-hydroxy-phenyl)propionate hydroxylase